MSLQLDKYLGFTYRGKTLGMTSSADFTGFIVNEENDLLFFNAPEVGNEFAIPQFGERTFYTGNTKSNRNIELNIQLDKISLPKYKEFLEWLNFDDIGLFVFDYNDKYGFEVKVQSLSTSEFHVSKEENCNDRYYANLTVVFTTVSDFASVWTNTYNEKVFFPVPSPNPLGISLIDNEKNLSFIAVDDDEYQIFNRHNVKNYFIIEFTNSLLIEEVLNPEEPDKEEWDLEELVKIEPIGAQVKGTFYSEFGIALKADGTFIPCGPNPLIKLEPNSSRYFIISETVDKIIPTSREIL